MTQIPNRHLPEFTPFNIYILTRPTSNPPLPAGWALDTYAAIQFGVLNKDTLEVIDDLAVECKGGTLSKQHYPELYKACMKVMGEYTDLTDDEDQFKLPDYRARVVSISDPTED